LARRYADTKRAFSDLASLRFIHADKCAGCTVFNVWFANSLQTYLAASKSDIVVNSVAPGFVFTSFAERIPESNEAKVGFLEVAKEKAYTMEEGGRFLIQAALQSADDSGKEQELKGVFLEYGRVTEVSEFDKGDVGKKVQEKLWVSNTPCLRIVSMN